MAVFNWSELTAAIPEIFLAVAGMVLLIAGVMRGNSSTRFLCWATTCCFLIAGLLLVGLDWDRQEAFYGLFLMDSFNGTMKILVLLGLGASLMLSVDYLYQEKIVRFEYPILVLFAGLGMLMMISSNNLLSLYMGLELQSLSLYVLAAIRRDSYRSAEAGIKYFVLGAISSGILLFGISLIYGFTGTTSFGSLNFLLADMAAGPVNPGVVIGLVFILSGLAFKVSAVPFHMWTPDVYEGSPTSVTAFFAIVPKVAALALMIRLLFEPFVTMAEQWMQIIWFISVASMVWGAFAAIAQENIKRLMAYSSIGHMGYALIGIVAMSSEGIGSIIVYLALYMVMTAGAFGVILSMRRDGRAVESLTDLSGLSKTSPYLAYVLAALMFSMSGIPPLAGFLGKFMIFNAAVASEMYVLAVIGVLSSVVAAYYYLRVIKIMFFDEAYDPFDKGIPFERGVVIFASLIFVLGIIFVPNPLLDTAQSAASTLFLRG